MYFLVSGAALGFDAMINLRVRSFLENLRHAVLLYDVTTR